TREMNDVLTRSARNLEHDAGVRQARADRVENRPLVAFGCGALEEPFGHRLAIAAARGGWCRHRWIVENRRDGNKLSSRTSAAAGQGWRGPAIIRPPPAER